MQALEYEVLCENDQVHVARVTMESFESGNFKF